MHGGVSVAERLKAVLKEKLSDFSLIEELVPSLTNWGVEDSDVLIHSLGVTYLTLLGHTLSFSSAAEIPTPRHRAYAHIGEGVRSDTVWFDRTTRSPVLIAEFERYSGQEHIPKLEEKVRNLLLAQHRWQDQDRLLVLAYWTINLVSLPEHNQLALLLKDGFETRAQERVAGTHCGQLLFFHFLFRYTSNQQLVLSEVIQRGSQ
jgi:hypothetical protein